MDSFNEAKRIFTEKLVGTMEVVAADAKVQVEFDPKTVGEFRQIGYQKRRLANADFRNDKADAGLVGGNRHVTALYEIKLKPGERGRLATVRLRYREPYTKEWIESQESLSKGQVLAAAKDATPSHRLAAAVAEFAEGLGARRLSRSIRFSKRPRAPRPIRPPRRRRRVRRARPAREGAPKVGYNAFMPAASLACPQCRKNYRVKEYDPARRYTCPVCRVSLGAMLSQAPTVAATPELGFADDPPPPPREIPVRLGKYLIEAEIGRGGMGVIYKGRQEGLHRIVAIKMLLGGFASDPASLERFHREARAAAKLRHPNIVAIHEVGDSNGQPFFTMDFIEGKSLDQLLHEGPIRPEEGARILSDVARAVHHAHEQGIIHRDIKPGNVLLDREGKPLVTDFGLAKELDSKSLLSMTGDVMGTPSFMSPEQAEGRVREIDRQTDVYALGAVLYRILTGRAPFEAPTMAATIYKVIHEYTTEPVRLNPHLSPELSAICMKAMEKEKKDRYATAEEFAQDLDRYLRDEPIQARPVTPWQLLKRRLRQQRRAVIAAGGVAVLAAVAIVAILALVGKSDLDLIEENLSKPELRLTAMGSLLEGLDRFKDRKRSLALARGAVERGTDESSRELAYSKPRADLADAYLTHITIERPEKLRIRLVQVLSRLRHKPAVSAMLDLLYSAKGAVRLEAIRYFKVVPDIRAFHALGSLVTDRECGQEARQAIQRLYVDRVMAIYNPAAGSATGALAGLGEAVEKSQRQMDELLRETGGRRAPKDAIDMAIAALRSPDRAERMKAAYELRDSKDARAREPLFGALRDPDEGVAKLAADSLASIGASEMKDRIADLLKDSRAVVRRNGAFLLGRIGDKSARPAVEAAYKSESDHEAKFAMEDALVALR